MPLCLDINVKNVLINTDLWIEKKAVLYCAGLIYCKAEARSAWQSSLLHSGGSVCQLPSKSGRLVSARLEAHGVRGFPPYFWASTNLPWDQGLQLTVNTGGGAYFQCRNIDRRGGDYMYGMQKNSNIFKNGEICYFSSMHFFLNTASIILP